MELKHRPLPPRRAAGRLPALVLAAGVALAAPAFANVFADPAGGDPRKPAPRKALPPVGLVGVIGTDSGTLHRAGTGFMVGPCLMMTARHAVGTEPKPTVRLFVAGAPTGYGLERVADGGGEVGSSNDWALLRVDGCPGLRADVGWMGLDPRGWLELAGKPVAAASLPFERPAEELAVEASCAMRVGDPGRRILGADCSATGGASGAPLFWLDAAGRPVAVALVTAVMSPTPGILPQWDVAHSTVAIPIADALTRTPRAMDAVLADWRKGANPLARSGVGVTAPLAPPRRGL